MIPSLEKSIQSAIANKTKRLLEAIGEDDSTVMLLTGEVAGMQKVLEIVQNYSIIE